MNIQHEARGIEARRALLAWCAGAMAAAEPWWPAAFAREVCRLPEEPTVGQVKAARRRASAAMARRFKRLQAKDPLRQWPAPKAPGLRQGRGGIVIWWSGGISDHESETALSVHVVGGGHADLQYIGPAPSACRWPAVVNSLQAV